jgi:hypothetical protein
LRKCKVIDAKSLLSYVTNTTYRAANSACVESRDQDDEDQLSYDADSNANESDNDNEGQHNDEDEDEEGEQSFKFVIWKLRELFKVCFVAHILSPIRLCMLEMCAT